MTLTPDGRLRAATLDDFPEIVRLWAMLFDEAGTDADDWTAAASSWFARFVDDPGTARFSVIEGTAGIVATVIGTLELGVPNPFCPRGRVVRLANLVTLPDHRGRGCATRLVGDVIEWARSIDADRVDLSATREGMPIYEKAGFTRTSAPRMKLVL